MSKDGPFKYTKEYFLLNYKVPQNEKYMVIESDVNCLSKAIHVINFDLKKTYNVGRRITNDVTVSDISVSRAQASIILIKNKVFVQDCDSKFGTFVKIRGLYPIDEKSENVVPIQVEKKCFFIRPNSLYSWWHMCLCPAVKILKKKYSSSDVIYDHFEDVIEKFPEEIHQVVMPEQYSQKQINKKNDE